MRAANLLILFAITMAGIVPIHGNDWVFTGAMPGGHKENITALIHKGDTVLSAGDDGFLGVWDSRGGGHAVERFQISPYSIVSMAERPGTDEICALESDTIGLYRISVWNYQQRRNIFTLQFRDPISHVSYSMAGNFIIAARSGRSGLVFIDSASGEILRSPQSLTGAVALAITGRSERNMLVYLSAGFLSYWDLESGTETSRFRVPANLSSPVLFSNSRYLAGTSADGLVVIHAASGEALAWDDSVPDGSLLCPAGDDLVCLVQNSDGAAELYRYTVAPPSDSRQDRAGSQTTLGRLVKFGTAGISAANNEGRRFTAVAATVTGAGVANAIALGTASGSLVLAGTDGRLRPLAMQTQTRITEAALSGAAIAFLAEDDTIGFIPLNYHQLNARTVIRKEANTQGYNRITAFTGEDGKTGQFIFWQDKNIRTQPVIRSADAGSEYPASIGSSLRSPVRSVDSLGGKILFLDSTGNISVVSPFDTGRTAPFTFFSVGLLDAAFVDRDRIILGRSAVSGNTPLLMITVNTGETVPLPYHSQAIATIHRGASGNIYAVAIAPRDNDAGHEARTSIVQLNMGSIANSARLVEFQEEDTQFSLAESPGSIAATIGGEGAAIYSAAGIQKLERTAGLPLRLIDGGSTLICLDRDGNICWYDNRSGKLLAVFRLHPDGWALQTEQRTVSGGITQ